jgi:UDP:flavonoid glycosyltransferase YjiC (YdhE family)
VTRRPGQAGEGGPDGRKRRVLFVAEAVTLAHVARCVTLARALDPDVYEVRLACDSRYDHLIGDVPFPRVSVRTIPDRQFFAALSRGTPIYSLTDLAGYVAEDLALIEDFRPDVVVGDFRLSLGVSARLSEVGYIAISNGYWSPYARAPLPVPDIALTRLVGVRAAQRIFDLSHPAVGAWHARVFNRLRKRYGLPPAVRDVRHFYTESDQTLYADLAELVPVADLPAHHRFIGPIPWSSAVACPPWWDSLPADLALVYVTLGSSGPSGLLPLVLESLADLPVVVVAATAGRMTPRHIPENAHVAVMLPGDRVAQRASLVVCNGGSPTSYQALGAGTPVIGICSNLDQYLNMALLERAGAGLLLRGAQTSAPLVRRTVRRTLEDEAIRARAAELGQVIARGRATDRFLSAVESVIGTKDELRKEGRNRSGTA